MKQRTVYPCKEFEPVEVPLDHLLSNGKISVYPEAERYFDIDYRAGRLVIAPKSNVGLIPINDRVAIHVLPRFPIENLFYILQRSNAVLRFIDGYVREYRLDENNGADPIALIGDQLIAACQGILRVGVLKQYVGVDDPPIFSGSLDLAATISQFRSRGINYKHVWHSAELTHDLFENRLIKSALLRVLAFYSEKNSKVGNRKADDVRKILLRFDMVDSLESYVNLREDHLARIIKRLPALHRDYSSVLWLSYLIHARRGVCIESVGRATFDTFVVNLADVFEDFVRLLVAEHFPKINKAYRVRNGNTDQVPLFMHDSKFKVKPDIYVFSGATAVAVLDAKYKPSTKPADRYEVLAFCEALQVKKAFLLTPATVPCECELMGRTAGGVEMYLAKINLSDTDMLKAEYQFLKSIEKVLHSAA